MVVKIKQKYFDVKLEIFNTIIQVFGSQIDEFENKTIKLDLTRILKGKSCEAKFILKKKDDALFGEIQQFRIFPSYIKRLIGRNISIVEDSFTVKIKDSVIRIKPFLITRKKVHRSVRKALRNTARDFLEKTVANQTRKEVFTSIASTVIQHTLNKKLKKIYPLAVCELRIVKVEKQNETE